MIRAGIFASFLILSACTSNPDMNYLVYFGTGANEPGKGFSMAHFDAQSGTLTDPRFVREAAGPSYLTISGDGKMLYSVNETKTFGDDSTGAVSAFTINKESGDLTLVNQVSSGGQYPCYITFDKSGKYLMVANYGGGNISVFALNKDGSIGKRTGFDQHVGSSVNHDRQDKAYAHSIQADPTNHFLLSCDLGSDRLYIYRFNSGNGSITPNDPPFASLAPGSGPRHFAFSNDARFVYVINEMLSTVTVFAWDGEKGTAKEVQTLSALPGDFTGENTTAEIRVHPNGKFLYGTNRGRDSIVLFTIDSQTGKLTYVEDYPSMGRVPRNFMFDPTGKWLIITNHGSGNGAIYAIDQETGKLTLHGEPFNTPSAFCVKFVK